MRHFVEKIKLKNNAIAAVERIFGNLRNGIPDFGVRNVNCAK